MLEVILIVVGVLVCLGLLVLMMLWDDARDYRAISAWAQEHNWTYSRGGERRWTEALPSVADKHVTGWVDGVLRGHAFTLVHAKVPRGTAGAGIVWISVVVVIVHLPSEWPAVEVTSSIIPRWRSTTDIVGHPEFDRRFRVRTDAPGGPQAVIPRELADAHVAGTVPPWSARGRELHVAQKSAKLTELDAAVDQAIAIGDLLGVPRST